MDRIQQLQQTHPWLSIDNARMLLCSAYVGLNELAPDEDISTHLQEYIDALCGVSQQQLKDHISFLQEFHLPDLL